jgi:hypothetical protein
MKQQHTCRDKYRSTCNSNTPSQVQVHLQHQDIETGPDPLETVTQVLLQQLPTEASLGSFATEITQHQQLTGACPDSLETAKYYSTRATQRGMTRFTSNSNILLSNSNSLGHVPIHLKQQHTTQQNYHTVTGSAPPETATYSATATHCDRFSSV